ncbi:MAG: sigma-70 family RNA polymerase sigma factor [Deltaproteobacteria bacterium]|nr:sigma-70 family RNA polymerase sigma factor [Deltaproteobacteria bacterium]
MASALPARHLRLVGPEPEAPESAAPAASDADVVAAFQLRERGAAEALHDRVRPVVDRTVARLLGARDHDFDDLVQVALIEIVLSLPRWRAGCSLATWATTIAARCVYKAVRRRRLERRIFDAATFCFDDLPDVRCAERDVRARSVLRRVRAHLSAIDEKKAWAFVLHDVFGHDVREVSEIMDASVAATQQRLSRGRRELLARIEGDPELSDLLRDLGGAR